MFCPNCGKKMTDGSTVCENCGYQLSQLQIEALRDLQAAAPTETTEAEAKREENATTAQKDEFFETPKTPAPEQPTLRVCPYCRSYLPHDVTYCRTCGSYVPQAQPMQSAPMQNPYGYPPAPPAPPIPKKKNTCALVGFIISLVAYFLFSTEVLGLLGGVASLVLGIVGLKQIKAGKGSGKGFAITAIVLGALTAFSALSWLVLEATGYLDMIYQFLYDYGYYDVSTM